MSIQSIRIVNIKGIDNRTFQLNITPNKPSLLYAPNGFGKSSIAVAFSSLNNRRINLNDDHFHRGDDSLRPVLEITHQRVDGTTVTLRADETTNNIFNDFDIFVINNQVKAKGTRHRVAGQTTFSASLQVPDIPLIDTIPATCAFDYSVADMRQRFGANGKMFINLATWFRSPAFIQIFLRQVRLLNQLRGIRISTRLSDFRDRINNQAGTTEELITWIRDNELVALDTIDALRNLTDQIITLEPANTGRAESILIVLQVLDWYDSNPNHFIQACERRLYDIEKQSYTDSFRAFNATWKDIRPRENDGRLIVAFPKVHHISNGQRDILTLVALLERAKRKLLKSDCILILDEVFDYLDDANLIAAQYYIAEFINEFKKQGRRIYPLILTHLSPGLFKSYLFSKMKVYYLDHRAGQVQASMRRLIQLREDPSIINDVSRYLLHYHTGTIAKRPEFTLLNLRPTWGENQHFQNYVDAAVQAYIADQPGYDPFAVCCAVRRKVEENIYNKIHDAGQQTQFLNTHMTREKLEYAERIGVMVPEFYYLLGLVYNEGMHWWPDRDNESPILAKLENGTIRSMIAEVFK